MSSLPLTPATGPLQHVVADAVPGRRRFDAPAAWITGLCLVLAGYALMGKGFAYLGVAPLFIGELLMLGGIMVTLTCPAWRRLADIPVLWLLVMLMAWGLLRTLPYLGRYKADALRDAVIFGYGTFTFLVAAWLIARPALLGVLLDRYRRFVPVFLLVVPVLWLAQQLLHGQFPAWPWANVAIIHLKAADILVHLAGMSALAIVGLDRRRSLLWPLLILLNAALCSVINRGGLVSFAAVVLIAFAFYPRSTWMRQTVIVGVLVVAALAIINPEIQTPNDRRKISFEQLTTNVMSMVSDTNKGDLDGTKQWRLDWWGQIIGYTFDGPHFWTGKGFGINLANDDGFQVFEDESLRSPHNGHLTILARAGVPGLALWAALQGGFALTLLGAIRRASRRGDTAWRAVFVFILAYWAGFMVNASFDVFIEGPMGGIWFWSLIGVGTGAVWVYRHAPDSAGICERPVPCA